MKRNKSNAKQEKVLLLHALGSQRLVNVLGLYDIVAAVNVSYGFYDFVAVVFVSYGFYDFVAADNNVAVSTHLLQALTTPYDLVAAYVSLKTELGFYLICKLFLFFV